MTPAFTTKVMLRRFAIHASFLFPRQVLSRSGTLATHPPPTLILVYSGPDSCLRRACGLRTIPIRTRSLAEGSSFDPDPFFQSLQFYSGSLLSVQTSTPHVPPLAETRPSHTLSESTSLMTSDSFRHSRSHLYSLHEPRVSNPRLGSPFLKSNVFRRAYICSCELGKAFYGARQRDQVHFEAPEICPPTNQASANQGSASSIESHN
jgi:hypothetical protein